MKLNARIARWLAGLGKAARVPYAGPGLADGRLDSPFSSTFGEALLYRTIVREAYLKNVWIYRCIRLICDALSSLEWEIQSESGDPVADAHPGAALLANPSRDMLWSEWVETWATYLLLDGAAHAELVGAEQGGEIMAMDLLSPIGLAPRPIGPTAEAAPYQYLDPDLARHFSIPYESVHVWRYLSPVRRLAHQSPTQPTAEGIATDNEARRWSRMGLANSAVPSGALVLPPEKQIDAKTRERTKRVLERGFSGSNAFKAMLLEGGAEWREFGKTAREMEYSQLRMLTAREICAAFGVSTWLAGAEEAKYENYRVARMAFWQDTVIPIAERLRRGLQAVYDRSWPEVTVAYSLESTPAMTGSFLERLEGAHQLAKLGYPINEINVRMDLGMPDQDWGDSGTLPTSLAPASVITDEGDDALGGEDGE